MNQNNITEHFFNTTFKLMNEIYQNDRMKNTIHKSKFKDELSMALSMKWISDTNNILKLTNRGEEIIFKQSPDYLRHQLKDYFIINQPSSLINAKTGHYNYFPSNIYNILSKAKLVNGDFKNILWWDEVCINLYDNNEKEKLEIGRSGEELILQYEVKKNKKSPFNVKYKGHIPQLGYDIESSMKFKSNFKKIYIEVKTSKSSLNSLSFQLSANQWQTMMCNKNSYYIYALSLKDMKFAKIDHRCLKVDDKYLIPEFPNENIVSTDKFRINIKDILKKCEILSI